MCNVPLSHEHKLDRWLLTRTNDTHSEWAPKTQPNIATDSKASLIRQSLRPVKCLLAGAIVFMMKASAQAPDDEVAARTFQTEQAYWPEQIAEGLNYPSAMVWLPNGDMLISERMGGLRILKNGKLAVMPVSGTPPTFQGLFDGMQDVLLDPDHEANQLIYILISEGTLDHRHAAVYRGRYVDGAISNLDRIFRAKEDVGRHSIRVSRMTFLADESLLLAIAEDHHEQAQQLSSHRGKLLRINRDGSIPRDNPFVSTPGALPEIWSYGHRVPLGLYQDVETREILEIEAGPRGGDELNVVIPGRNYGWARASWGFTYGNNGPETRLQSGPGIEDPILIWMPSVTPSGLTRYRGAVYPYWNGDYFVGHLTGKCLERIRIDGGRVVLQERMLMDLGERIRDVKVGPDRLLYLLTDHQNGRVVRVRWGRPHVNQLSSVARKLEDNFDWSVLNIPTGGEEAIAGMDLHEIARGRQAFMERCATCHKVGSVVNGGDIGPDLAGVYGSLMGRRGDFDYSPEMADSVLIWGFATLSSFLSDPRRLVPGTKMTSSPVTDPEVRLSIIGFLKHQPPQ